MNKSRHAIICFALGLILPLFVSAAGDPSSRADGIRGFMGAAKGAEVPAIQSAEAMSEKAIAIAELRAQKAILPTHFRDTRFSEGPFELLYGTDFLQGSRDYGKMAQTQFLKSKSEFVFSLQRARSLDPTNDEVLTAITWGRQTRWISTSSGWKGSPILIEEDLKQIRTPCLTRQDLAVARLRMRKNQLKAYFDGSSAPYDLTHFHGFVNGSRNSYEAVQREFESLVARFKAEIDFAEQQFPNAQEILGIKVWGKTTKWSPWSQQAKSILD